MRIIYSICTLLIASATQAQLHDSLAEVQIQAHRFQQYKAGYRSIYIDSSMRHAYRTMTLADLLAHTSPVSIRSYGYSTMATASLRGSTAEQTAVLWNGFNLQSQVLGVFNFSLFPVEWIDDISIQTGGNGALFGSGAVGGSIVLNSKLALNQAWNASAAFTTGSFGFNRYYLHAGYSGKTYAIRTKFMRLHSRNDFPFINTTTGDDRMQRMTNSNQQQWLATVDQFWKLSARQTLQINSWWQRSEQLVPPAMTESSSDAKRTDNIFRTAINWKYGDRNKYIALRSALFSERMQYSKNSTDIQSRVHALSSINEVEYHTRLAENLKCHGGIHYTYTVADNTGYVNRQSITRAALYYGTVWNIRRWLLQHTARVEAANGSVVPFMPSLGIEYLWLKQVKLTANVARSYRLPTLNEMYWQPYGNPDLLPESGWNGDIGLKIHSNTTQAAIEAGVHYYERVMNNQIMWLMRGNDHEPVNAKQTYTRGAELFGKVSFALSDKLKAVINSQLNLTHARNLEAIRPGDNSANKYILFIPRLGHQHQLSLNHKKFSIALSHQYTGMRFTSTDNTQAIDAFHTTDAAATYRIYVRKHLFALTCNVFNITNQVYTIMPNQPMPGRNFQFTLSYHL